jgi:ATP-binding cassette subfamily F protein uup
VTSDAPGGSAKPPRLAPGSAAERAAKKDLQRLERQIEKLSERAEKLHAELAANATDYAKLTELGDQLSDIQDEKSALEERWLEVAAELD